MLVKDVKGFEGLYTVDEYGNIYSLRSKKYIKQRFDKDGYLRVHLCKKCKDKDYSVHKTVHRIVAETFIPNDDPINKTTVDHIDTDKTNNHISNLRWLSVKENTSKANKDRDYSSYYKKIKAINVKTQEEYFFDSRKECTKFVGCTHVDICSVLKGKQKTSHGYTFENI